MTENTSQAATSPQGDPQQASSTDAFSIQAAPMAHNLAHPDTIFPPIPEEQLVDGRTKEGRRQRAYLAQREAYIAAWEMAHRNERMVFDNLRRHNAASRTHAVDVASYKEQIRNLESSINLVGPYMVLAIVLGLLIQRRPQTVQVTPDGLTVSCALGNLTLVVYGKQQCFRLTAPDMEPRTFDFDDEGNLLDESLERLIGYLAMAGYKVNPEHVKLALSSKSHNVFYSDPNAKINAMARALGHTALMGTEMEFDLPSFRKGGTRAPQASGVDTSMYIKTNADGSEAASFGPPKSGLFMGIDMGKAHDLLAGDYILIITDGMSHPGDQKS